MAKTNSYTLRDGLGMLEAIIGTDGKVMSRGQRQACRKIIADLRAQLPAEVAPMSEMKRQRIVGIAGLYFEQMHPGLAKQADLRASRV
jgi:hypothetical protein